jgi:hypothetical protein
MSILRSIEPEWLDTLPADDPGARGSRRDLRRLNFLMLHDRIIARALAAGAAGKPRTIIEIGAGDGAFMLSVAQRLAPRWPNVSVTLLDRQRIVSEESRRRFASLGWQVNVVTSDIFDFLDGDELSDFDAVVANLFLHHFREPDLARLFRRIADMTPFFVACEPRRGFPAIEASRLLWTIGCNGVTRHDAAASARAGFRDRELSALWPEAQGWQLRERPAGLFSHSFVARCHVNP